jgi:hypothetical protein
MNFVEIFQRPIQQIPAPYQAAILGAPKKEEAARLAGLICSRIFPLFVDCHGCFAKSLAYTVIIQITHTCACQADAASLSIESARSMSDALL